MNKPEILEIGKIVKIPIGTNDFYNGEYAFGQIDKTNKDRIKDLNELCYKVVLDGEDDEDTPHWVHWSYVETIDDSERIFELHNLSAQLNLIDEISDELRETIRCSQELLSRLSVDEKNHKAEILDEQAYIDGIGDCLIVIGRKRRDIVNNINLF